jgi:hypothetical protein
MNYCCHGNYQGQMHHFFQESHQSKPLLPMVSFICGLYPDKTTRVPESCYFSTKLKELV